MKNNCRSDEVGRDSSSKISQLDETNKTKVKTPWTAAEDDILIRFVGNRKTSLKW